MTPADVCSSVKCVKSFPPLILVALEQYVLFLMCVCVCVGHREDRESRFLSSKMAIVAAFRSWSGKLCLFASLSIPETSMYSLNVTFIFFDSGIINLCKAGNSGIQSLIGLLCIPNMEVRVSIEAAACRESAPGDNEEVALFVPAVFTSQPQRDAGTGCNAPLTARAGADRSHPVIFLLFFWRTEPFRLPEHRARHSLAAVAQIDQYYHSDVIARTEVGRKTRPPQSNLSISLGGRDLQILELSF